MPERKSLIVLVFVQSTVAASLEGWGLGCIRNHETLLLQRNIVSQ
jgi:hypothetical protein